MLKKPIKPNRRAGNTRRREKKKLKWREGEHKREREMLRGGAESQYVSIDRAIKIDGCLDEYQHRKASAGMASVTADMIEHLVKAAHD